MVCTQLKHINWKSQGTAVFHITGTPKYAPWKNQDFGTD